MTSLVSQHKRGIAITACLEENRSVLTAVVVVVLLLLLLLLCGGAAAAVYAWLVKNALIFTSKV